MKIKDTDFMYASTRLRAADGKGLPRERLERFASCQTETELLRAIGEFYPNADIPDSIEGAATAVTDEGYRLLRESVSDPSVFNFLAYKYDCCNLKLALKSHILHTDYSYLYYNCGTVSPEQVAQMPKTGDWSVLPHRLAAAAPEALDHYGKTGEGRAIDIILDSACFADINECVSALGVKSFSDYCRLNADFANILTAVRLYRMSASGSAVRPIVERSVVTGGAVPTGLFFPNEGEIDLSAIAEYIPDKALQSAISSLDIHADVNFGKLDNELDRAQLAMLAPYKYLPFGKEVPFLFILGREYEIKNFRRIAAGLRNGNSPSEIRERLCWAYV